MSRHEGVSCDSCLKGNFRGRRYKCLVCYDYDLCASCYEAGVTTTRHLSDHPMQCILTRTDFELYYGGEGVSVEQPQSLTCPYCTRMGFTEATLQEHVASDHPDTTFEVVCPVCASLPGGDPNHVTDDFANHLTTEHRSGPRDLISLLDEPTSSRHGPRRIPHSSRGAGGQRTRRDDRTFRSNMLFSSSGGLSPSSRDSIDPIAELLSQLSGVRRAGTNTGQTSQLQQLQMQLQLERQQVRAASRHQLERLPRRQPQAIGSVSGGTSGTGSSAGGSGTSSSAIGSTSGSGSAGGSGSSSGTAGGSGGGGTGTGGNHHHHSTMAGVVANNSSSNNTSNVNPSSGSANSQNSMFLLPRCITSSLSETQLQNIERDNANRSLFVRELVIGTLSQTVAELTEQLEKQQLQLQSQMALQALQELSRPTTVTVSSETKSTTTLCDSNDSNKDKDKDKDVDRDADGDSKSSSCNSSPSVTEAVREQSQPVTSKSSTGQGPQSSSPSPSPQTQTQIQTQSQSTVASNTHTATSSVASNLQTQAGLPSANPIVQTLMHNVLPPQPLQPLPPLPPTRNTGTGTIRESATTIGASQPPAYLSSRGGVNSVNVTTNSSRRKPVRSVDGRNQSTEPPPPH